MKVQVETSHYNFPNYVNQDRWDSYYQQIFEASKCKGKNILYIGTGDGIVVDILRKIGKNVKTLDFDKNLKPDYVGSVTEIKKILGKDKFDVILCCQVLEHIPYSEFENIIKQLSECTQKRLIISLPNCYRKARFYIDIKHTYKKLFLLKRHSKEPWDLKKDGNGEHYWEIGGKGCPTQKDIIRILKKYIPRLNCYTLFDNPYHMFFVIDKESL